MEFQSTQDREESARETSKIICECINNLLTDIPSVIAELQDDTKPSPQSQMVLQFLHHCVDAFPECYVTRPPSEASKTSLNVSTDQHKSLFAKDFTCWVLSRLLRILSSPGCDTLHAKSVSVINCILKLVKTKDISFYKHLISEFFGLYEDILCEAETYFENDEEEDYFTQTLFCGRFLKQHCDVDHDLIPARLIELKEYANIQFLLKSVSIILEENIRYIQQFLTNIRSSLYTVVIRTLQLCDVQLIFVSLKLLVAVVEIHESMTSSYFSQYVLITMSILEYLLDDATFLVDWLPLLKYALHLIVTKDDLDRSMLQLFLKKVTFVINACSKRNVYLCLEEVLLDILFVMIHQNPTFLHENVDNVMQVCLENLGKRELSKVAHTNHHQLLYKLSTMEHSLKTSVYDNLTNKIKELQSLVLSEGNNEFVWMYIEGVNLLYKVLLSSHQHIDLKKLSEVFNVEVMVQHIVRLFLDDEFHIKLTKDVQIKAATETFKYLVHCLKLCIVTDTKPNDVVKRSAIEMSSLPWLTTIDPPWFDFKPAEYSESQLLTLYNRRKLCFTDKVLGKCLQLLSLLGGVSKCITWFSHVIRNALVHPSEVVQKKTLKYFPNFVYFNTSSFYDMLTEELVTLARSSSQTVQTSIGEAVCKLVCVVSGNVLLEMTHGKLLLKCKFCERDTSNQDVVGEQKDIAVLFKPFFLLFKHSISTTLKVHLLDILKVLVLHMSDKDRTSPASMSIWKAAMELLKDPSFEIRFAFSSKMAVYLNGFQNVAMHQFAIDSLSGTFSQAAEINDVSVMETIVVTMGCVGKVSKGDLLSVMVVSLFNCFITQNKFIASVASDQIHQIARSNKWTCQQLFVDHKNQLSDIAVKKFFKILTEGKDVHSVTEAFFDIAKLFEFPDVKAFLTTTSTEMLPKIVQHASSRSSIILRLFAKYLNINRREMMFYNFKYIFSYIIRTVSKESELESCLRYLQDETDVELSSLLLSESQSVFNQLILYLSVNREQVYQGFSILASNDTSYKGPKEIRSDSDIALLLHHKLLGVLAFFNSVLTHSPNYEKKIALKSIICLLNIMGPKYLTPVRLKVMAILKLTFRLKDDFPDLCCAAWDCFVRNIDVETLGSILGQIVATLLPLLDTCSDQVAAILNFLIIENRSALNSYFTDIYYIPPHPSLAKIKRIIDSSHVTIRQIKDFKTQILSLLKGIKSENESVQKFALIRVCDLLDANPSFSDELRSDSVDPVIKELINMLLQCCNEQKKDTLSLVGKCFGLLGAIDPGRLENTSKEVVMESTANTDITDINFAYDLINELCRSFLAANNTRAQDCAAFALQEILQFYHCTDQYSDSDGYQLWLKFSNSTQELLYPHLQSKYVNSTNYNWSRLSLPIFESVKGSVYKEWICNWTNYMIYKLDSPNPTKVFQPCMSIIKHDLRTALFLLPHVVLSVIQSSNADIVRTDIMAVLQSAMTTETQISEFKNSCAQTVFSILDFLNVWYNNARHATNTSSSSSGMLSKNIKYVAMFLKSIPKDILAFSSFHCNALSRSLMYYEEHIELTNGNVEDHLEFLQKIYYALDEPDGIAGIAATRKKNTSLKEQIIEHESSGNLRDAVACYERAIQIDTENVKHHTGFLNCLIRLGQLNNALMDVSGVMEKRPDWSTQLQPYQTEIAWRLGHWDILGKTVNQKENLQQNWSSSLGQILICLKDKNIDEFGQTIASIRSVQTQRLLSASVESGGYQRAYNAIIRLHMLTDIETCSAVRFHDNPKVKSRDLLSHLDHRLDVMESSFKSKEPVLNLKRILLALHGEEFKLTIEQDNSWLKTAKIARKDGLFQTAYSSLLNVNANNRSDFLIEQAKWYACQKDLHNALLTLQKGSAAAVEQRRYVEESNNHFYAAKISLLKAIWMEETEYYEPEPVLAQYKDAVEKNVKWEKGHFCLAKYYEKLMNAWDGNKEGRKKGKQDFIRFVVKHYGESLQYGSKYIYQSMPRLLTLWLDFGQDANQVIEGNGRQVEKTKYKEKMQKLNDEIIKLSKVLPAYQFLTAFSQLVSRICHKNVSVWNILKSIICKIFAVYKEQAIWSMVAVYKSSINTRSERCKVIFQEMSSADHRLKQFISHCLELTDHLLNICNRRVLKENKLSMARDFPALVRLLGDRNFSEIIVPLQSTLTVQLPCVPDPQQKHNPFPENLPIIVGVEDHIDVLSSLQKPKKICVRASNGCKYALMCKPKDDLRKDNRLMEFNSLVNKLLLRDPDCRRRQLHIRTYAVIPLNEECGLLEWVPNTSGLRYILNKIYKEKGIVVKIQELKQLYEPMKSSNLRTKVDIFVNRILPKYPPVFNEWFLNSFSSPTKWYMARLAYCRTSAVMSMVGYTLGLGDRHGENILFDSMSGDCVHVDFNCLFNKGETFDCPERVPFRLTNNMINAMGPLRYEGVFRKSCEMAMKLMRHQRDSLLSVLNTFLYDPLVEWKKEARRQSSGETTNELALKILKNVEHRLTGYMSSTMIHLPLSIEGQVHQLIKESTDLENLARMYIGWAAYM